MSFTSTFTSVEYDGNNSDETPYPIPFPFLTTGSIRVAVTQTLEIGVADTITPGVGFTDYEVTLSEGMDPENDVPAVGDLVRDSDDNEGTIIALTNNENGTFSMRIAAQDAFAPGLGLAVFHRKVDLLNSNEFTVTQLTNGLGSLVTDDAVPVAKTVRIWRVTTMNQLLDLQPAGEMPSVEVERAFDKLTMIAQELSDRLAKFEGTNNHALVVPVGLSVFGAAEPFVDSAARGAAIPGFIGQMGVQLDTGVLYRGTSLAAGQWTEFRHRAWDRYQPIAYNVPVETLVNRWIGTVPATGTLRELIVCFATAGTVSIDVDVTIGGEAMPTATVPIGATALAVALTGTATAGQQIKVSTTPDYGAADALGLEIFIETDRS